MRILGLDYGDKTIGVSISDSLGLTAQGIEIIRRPDEKSIKKSIARLREIIREYDIKTLVLGYPKNMDNSEGIRCQKTLEFRDRLKRNFKSMEIILWDERLSTVAAERNLKASGLNFFERKEVVDKIAAVYILQGYLDYINNKNSEGDITMGKNNDDFDEIEGFEDDDVIESITVTDEDGNEIEFYILDVLEHKGSTYLLVIEDIEEDDTEATIIKEVEVDGDEVVYELLEDDEEFNIIAELFENNTEDYDIEL